MALRAGALNWELDKLHSGLPVSTSVLGPLITITASYLFSFLSLDQSKIKLGKRSHCPLVTHHVRYPCKFCLCVTPLPRWVMSLISPGSFFQGAWFVLTFGFMTGTSSSSLVLPVSEFVVVSWSDILKSSAIFSPFLANGTRPDRRLFICGATRLSLGCFLCS